MNTVPAALIAEIEEAADLGQLDAFPKIQEYIFLTWGTVRLKQYLEQLLGDTRDNTRKGFPQKAVMALLALHMENTKHLEKMGITDEDPISMFTPPQWDIPSKF